MAIKEIKTKSYEEWKELRHQYIGGSDAAAVVGLNRFKSAYALWAEKTNKMDGFGGNLATEVGTYLEDFVAHKFANETGKKVRRKNRSLVNDEYPFAIANIDREIVGEDAGLEIKTTSDLNMGSFKNGEYPQNYYVQCVHYLAVTGKARWYLAVLIGNKEFKIFTIDRDEEEIKALMDAEKDFWAMVESGNAPLPDGSDSSTQALSSVNSDVDNDRCVDIEAYNTDIAEYMRLGELIKNLKSEQSEVCNRIKAYMGEAGRAESDRFKVSWRQSFSSRFDVKAFEDAHPELEEEIKKFYKSSETRTFRVSAINI